MNRTLAALAALLVLSGCGGTTPDTGPVKGKPIDPAAQAQANLLAEVDGLKSQVQRLSAEVEDLSLQVRTLSEGDGSGGAATLPEVSRRVTRLEGNLKQMASQLGVEVDGQQPAAGPGLGVGQEQQHAAGQQGQQPPAGQQPVAGPQGQQPSVGHSQPAVQGSQATQSADPAEALYAKGMQAFQGKEYDKAIALWRDVAKSYPKHTLAPNASFWLGEAYFQKGDYGQAVLNYNEVVEKFPKSNKAPSAMLKMGMAFQKLNKKDAARLMFQDLIKKFPDSAEARRAKSLL